MNAFYNYIEQTVFFFILHPLYPLLLVTCPPTHWLCPLSHSHTVTAVLQADSWPHVDHLRVLSFTERSEAKHLSSPLTPHPTEKQGKGSQAVSSAPWLSSMTNGRTTKFSLQGLDAVLLCFLQFKRALSCKFQGCCSRNWYGWMTLKVQSTACLYLSAMCQIDGGMRMDLSGQESVPREKASCQVTVYTHSSMMHIPRIRHICLKLSMTSFNPSCHLSSLLGAFIKAESCKQIDGIRTGRNGASNRVKYSHCSHVKTLRIITNKWTILTQTLGLSIFLKTKETHFISS